MKALASETRHCCLCLLPSTLLLTALLSAITGFAETNNLALTPPMGWNDWNSYTCGITESDITSYADAISTNGMAAVGYQFINIDDCWQSSRTSNGIIVADSSKFPHGMAWLANYVHSKGLKFGLYTDHGTATCQGKPGSYGYEYVDAFTYASWGVDYLKEDSCNIPAGATALADYGRMSDALQKCGRPITFSICGGNSQSQPGYASWSPALGNLWRTTADAQSSYSNLITHFDPNSLTAFVAGPGRWNDPDMMELGRLGMGTGSANQVQFTMWSIMAAPLIMGNNFNNMTAQAEAILTNPEAIAVDQDPAGEQGVKVVNNISSTATNEVWSKTLGYDFSTKAVALLNRLGPSTNITVYWTNIGLQAGTATVRDLWAHTNLGTFTNSFTTNVPSTNVVMLEVVGTPPALPATGTNYLSDLQSVYSYTGSGTMTKDESIGGNTITLNGVTYPKGIGVNAFAGSDYDLGGVCSRFQATIGVDDEVGSGNGSVIFQVFADGTQIYNSGVMIGGSPPQTINLDVTGVRRLILGVGDADDNTNNDHADWANALVIVTNTTPMPPYAPTGLTASPGNQISLTWNATVSANSYNVKRALNSNGPYTNIGSSPIAAYTDSNVFLGTTYYYVVSAVSSIGESASSTSVGIAPCVLPTAPTNVTVSGTGSSTTVAWSPVTGATSYGVWRFTGNTPTTNIASVTGTNYTDTTATNTATNYYYLLTAANACNQSGYSAFIVVPVTLPGTPTGLAATAGDTQVALSWMAVTGANSYNVKRSTTNGGPYVTIQINVTTTNYLDTAVTDGTTYYYVVSAVISGNEGSNSSPVSATPTIALGSPPSITTQPASQTNYATQTATFTVAANSISPLYYQWCAGATGSGVYTNLIAGGQYSAVTNATLTVSNLVAGNAADYVVVVTNANGSVTSAVARLTVLSPVPSITMQPASRTNSVGQTAIFTVSASGLSPLSYQWQVQSNGVYANLNAGGQFSSVTNATLTISNLAPGNATNYEVIVTNSAGSVTSAVATLTVIGTPPSITTQPASQTNYATQAASFTVSAGGTAPLFYQWRVASNGVYANLNAGGQFSSVTNATLTISGLVAGNATNYEVVVTNSAGAITSAVATLTVLAAAPSITTQPASQTNYVGQAATFTVTAAGLAPLSYQWRAGTSGSGGPYTNLIAGGQFSAVTNATMTVSNLVTANAADYVVVVTNASGAITSAVARLTVLTNSSYKSTILADHPMSYWPLNETSGTVIHDLVGTNNGTCVNTNGLTLGGPGILYSNGVTTDTAIYFNDANSGYINIPYSATLNTPQLTVEAWLKLPIFPDGNAGFNMNPLSLDNANSPSGWAFEIPNPNGSNPQMDGWLASGGWTQISGGTCIQSQWSYYTLTYNGTNFCIYTNGALAGSSASIFTQVSSGHPLYLGAYNDSGTADRFYLGGMENVAFYSNALSASHILTHYQVGTNAALAAPPTMSIQKSGSNVTVSWTSGFLQKAAYPAGPWLYVTNATSPYTNGGTNSGQYFRATLQSSP